MNIKDLVVTGIVKFLKVVSIDTLIVEKLNEVTKSELDSLHGVTSNIQDQIESVSSSLKTAELEQKNFKGAIVRAINAIPRNPNNPAINFDSALSQITHNLGEIEHGPDVGMVTATTDTVIQGYKFVDKDWNVVTGTIPLTETLMSNNISMTLNGSAFYICTPNTNPNDVNINDRRCIDRAMGTNGSNLGTAKVDEVLAGKTFTSTAGIKKSGTIPYHDVLITNHIQIGDKKDYFYIGMPGTDFDDISVNDRRCINRAVGTPASNLGDATPADVVEGKTFTSVNGIKQGGKIIKRAGFYHNGTKDASHGSSDNIVCGYGPAQNCWGVNAPKPFYYIRMPNGYYGGWGADSNAEVEVDAEIMNARIGLTADRIKKGVTIAGIDGTFEGQTITGTVFGIPQTVIKGNFMSGSNIADETHRITYKRFSTGTVFEIRVSNVNRYKMLIFHWGNGWHPAWYNSKGESFWVVNTIIGIYNVVTGEYKNGDTVYLPTITRNEGNITVSITVTISDDRFTLINPAPSLAVEAKYIGIKSD